MKSQKGSAHVVVIVVLIVAVLSLLGFIFWQNFMRTTQDSKNTPSSKAQNVTRPAVSPTPQVLTANEASQLVQKTYSTYISERKSGKPVAESLSSIKANFTNSAYDTLLRSTDQEALTCAINYIPDSVTLVTTIDGTTATSNVTRITNSQTASAMIQVTTDISTGKISNVSCPS